MKREIALKNTEALLPDAGGYCQKCQGTHILESRNAKNKALEFMSNLEKHGHLGFLQEDSGNIKGLNTDSLFGQARGKMFGVLEGIDQHGNRVTLHAFSGQFNGRWNVSGWAPPLFNTGRWHAINSSGEQKIKKLSAFLERLEPETSFTNKLRQWRKALSRKLMKDLHHLYVLPNFNGHCQSLLEFFPHTRGVPTGAADCCAPKLLNAACRAHITPTAMAEFYWGRENRSATRKHGHFYPPCEDKCTPILGFMLCGIDKQEAAGRVENGNTV